MSNPDDKKLVEEFLQKKTELSFRKLYRIHAGSLYRLAYKLTNRNQSLAEEVVQEMWCRAVTRLADFRWESSLKTWLSGILINCSREQLRKTNLTDVTIEEIEHSLAEMELKHENRIDTQKALSALPHGYREILILHDVEGYKHKEIAQLLNISEGTSKWHLSEAKKQLTNCFEKRTIF